MPDTQGQSRELSNQIAIATTTFYNPNSESDSFRIGLAKKSIRTACNLGYKVVVVDGGSPSTLLKEGD